MANLALNDIWMVRYAAYTSDQAAINTVHYRVTSLTGTVADTAVVNTLDTAVHTAYKNIMSDDARYRGVSAQRVLPTPKSKPAVRVLNDGSGLIAGEILPSQVTGIISAATAFAGRSQRARVYLPFPSETDSEVPGIPTAAYVANAQTLANLIYADQPIVVTPGVNEALLSPIVFHRAGSTFDYITTKTAKRLWATQRRRGSFGQRNTMPF